MFAKLLKYEWKASKGILGILSLAALGAGILGAVVLRVLIINLTRMEQAQGAMVMLPALLILALVFLMLGLFAYGIGSELFLLYRFYKNKFTDEGYLTFTLPATPKQIFLASFVNMAIWMLIITVVLLAAMGILILGGIISTGYVDFPVEYGEFFGAFEIPWDMVAVNLLYGIMSFVYSIVMCMTAVTVGAVAAKKHKLLAAFGIYYGISMVYGIVQTAMMVAMTLSNSIGTPAYYLPEIGFQVLLILVGFFLSTYLMEKKLNLP